MLRKSLQILWTESRLIHRRKVLSHPLLVRLHANKSRERGYVAHCGPLFNHIRTLCTPPISPVQPTIDRVTYDQVCEETLESLTEYFDEIVENATNLKSSDVAYSDGVLTVQFGAPYGTYVINRQSPNMQIWLSSPHSGPKRFDFVDNCWIYRRTNESLHELLDAEISKIVNTEVDFQKNCAHGKR